MSIQTAQPYEQIIKLVDGKSIVTDGPLSAMYADALNEIYKKETDPTTGLTLESQANDALSARNYWLATQIASSNFANVGQDVGMVYGVKKQTASIGDVVAVNDAFSQMTDGQRQNSAVILDEGTEKWVENVFTSSLEALCLKHQVPVFTSLESYILSLKGVD